MSNFEIPNPAADVNSNTPESEPQMNNAQVPPADNIPPADNVPPAGTYYQPPVNSQPLPSGFYAQLRALPWRRANDGWLGGVAQAISRQYGWDVALVRCVIIVAGLVAAPFTLFAYALAWALVPSQYNEKIELEEFLSGRFSGSQVVIGIEIFLALSSNVLHFNLGVFDFSGLFSGPLFIFSSFGLVLALIGVVIALVVMSEKRSRRNNMQNNPPVSFPFPPNASAENFSSPPTPVSADITVSSAIVASTPIPPATPVSPAVAPANAPQPTISQTTSLPFYNPGLAETPIPPIPAPPLYYAPTPAPIPTPEKWGKGPGLATFLGMTGFLVLFGSIAFYLTTHFAGTFMVPTIAFPIALIGMGFVMAGVVLAYLAFSGRKGTWLTGLTVFLAICSPGVIGLLVEVANNHNFYLTFPF